MGQLLPRIGRHSELGLLTPAGYLLGICFRSIRVTVAHRQLGN